MIDLEGLPSPDDAPEPGACVRVERPEPGLVRLVLDPPHRPKIAVFDVPLLRDLDAAVDALANDGETKGVVITGREPLSFAAGADVEAIASLSDAALAFKFSSEVQKLFQRIHRLGRDGGGRLRTVAAVGGPVPGGACEITLACDRTLLADDDKTRIGLPEVLLGIFPAWGGTTRLPRRIGVPAALTAILNGKLYRARQARKLGLVDRLTKPEYLLRIADDIAMGRLACPRFKRSWMQYWFVDRNPLAGAVIASMSRKQVLAKTKGHYPAPLTVLPLIVRAPRISLEAGLAAEVEEVRPLSTSPTTKNLVRLFLASEAAKKLGNLPDGKKAPRVTRAAVIGAGVMGGAIASLMAARGVGTRLRDLDRAQLDAALLAHQREIAKQKKRRRLTRAKADAALDRLEVTTEPVGFGRCQLAIEAVAERLEVKRAVLGELAGLLPEDAILATNTSSLSVDAIAADLPHPERVVGLHFFNPVRRMPLVEVVRGEVTSDETVARAARLALDLGKTPVVTRDVPGFLVNRVLGPYLDEAVRLLAAGVPPQAIDDALVAFGMPMGPIELLDEVGLDIASHAARSLHEGYGERMTPAPFLAPLVDADELGKKTGTGLYRWTKGKGGKLEKAGVNPRLAGLVGSEASSLSRDGLTDRCVLAYVAEAARALDEKVVASPTELDLACVYGTGFAPFRGGPLRYVDARGARRVVDALNELERITGGERAGRYAPSDGLRRLAESDGAFHGEGAAAT